MNVIAFSVYLIVLVSPVYVMKIERTYKRLWEETSVGNTYQTTVSVRSKIQCATTCSLSGECISFTYNKTTKSCRLSSEYKQPEYYEKIIFCPEEIGYTYEQNHNLCFRFESSSGNTLAQAKATCESEGAHLVFIENNGVDQFLVDEISRKGLGAGFFFIDGSDEDVEGIWKSSSGDIMTYTNLHSAEGNGGSGENCLTICKGRSYLWADVACATSAAAFICQIDIQ